MKKQHFDFLKFYISLCYFKTKINVNIMYYYEKCINLNRIENVFHY